MLGPFLAIISFVCSVGNVPLAAALWQGGISFGGVVSFVFADLITLPLLSIYRKYFGTAITLRILAVFWATMSIAGLAVEYLFKAVRISDPVRPTMIVHEGFQLNYTSVLNVLALVAFAVIYWLYRHRDTSGRPLRERPGVRDAGRDRTRPRHRARDGQQYWFCSDHCQHRFTADPARYLTTVAGSTSEPTGTLNRIDSQTGVDPVCGMTVDVDGAEHTADHHGTRYYFCGAGCRAAFLKDPEPYFTQAPAAAPGSGVLKTNAPSDRWSAPVTVTDHDHPIDPERVAHARRRLPSADDAARLTGLLSLMADPVRLRLIYALDIVEELCVGDLASPWTSAKTPSPTPCVCSAQPAWSAPARKAGSCSTGSRTTSPLHCAITACANSSPSPIPRTPTTPRTDLIAPGAMGTFVSSPKPPITVNWNGDHPRIPGKAFGFTAVTAALVLGPTRTSLQPRAARGDSGRSVAARVRGA